MKDPLLRLSRFAIWIMAGVFAAGGALLLIGLVTYIVWQTGALGPIPQSASALAPEHLPELPLALLLALLASGIALFFALQLGRIVDSVGAGDPFSCLNADRLRTMALLAIAYQAVSFGLFSIGITVARMEPIESLVSGEDISLNALMLALVLFILARVFRQGATMREDLEGTV